MATRSRLACATGCPAPVLPAGDITGSQLCRGTLPLVQVVLGVLLPTLVSIWAWKPDVDVRGEGAQEHQRSLVSRMLRRASRARVAADHALQVAFQGRHTDLPHPAFLCWWVLVCCWVWCKTSAGL